MQLESGIDAAFQRAVDAGFEVLTALDNMFWGDRYGMLRDSFRVTWSLDETSKA
ncbi:VOC family protein [Phenylobacterium sp.]|uniref:VOC family protein n=1 Tax=Phenylobacterium sp. TaxID=1871053 RepID=UPI003982E6EF